MVVAEALKKSARGRAFTITLVGVPLGVYRNREGGGTQAIGMPPQGDVAIFIERLFADEGLQRYRERILVPNPEWLDPESAPLAQGVTGIWHKTRFSFAQLARAYPGVRHCVTGFTSPHNGRRVEDYSTACHCRGKSVYRNTQNLLDLWLRHPEWCDVKFQLYSDETGFVRIPEWVRLGNVAIRLECLERGEYEDLISGCGIHLCTSEVEGFGHYINEGRASGALVVTLDAPPMNELVDDDSGVLVKTTGSRKANFGVRYQTSTECLEEAIDRVCAMPLDRRRQLGANALARYGAERKAYFSRVSELAAAF